MKISDPTSLQNLHDIILPQPIPWLPPAPGWYAMAFGLLLLISWFSVQKYLCWKRNKYRREALAELAELNKSSTDSTAWPEILPQLPQLVKRTAMAAYGRSSVASLSGEGWLDFLDTTGSTHIFSRGSGQLLYDCSYCPAAQLVNFSSQQITELLKAVSYWIRHHQNSIET